MYKTCTLNASQRRGTKKRAVTCAADVHLGDEHNGTPSPVRLSRPILSTAALDKHFQGEAAEKLGISLPLAWRESLEMPLQVDMVLYVFDLVAGATDVALGHCRGRVPGQQ